MISNDNYSKKLNKGRKSNCWKSRMVKLTSVPLVRFLPSDLRHGCCGGVEIVKEHFVGDVGFHATNLNFCSNRGWLLRGFKNAFELIVNQFVLAMFLCEVLGCLFQRRIGDVQGETLLLYHTFNNKEMGQRGLD